MVSNHILYRTTFTTANHIEIYSPFVAGVSALFKAMLGLSTPRLPTMSSISTAPVIELVCAYFIFISFPPIIFFSFTIIIKAFPTIRRNALIHKTGFPKPSNRAIIEQSQLKLTPNHLVDDAHIALHDLYHLGADILVHIVGNGDTMLTVTAEHDGSINGLQQGLLVDTSNDEVTLVDSFGTLGRGADANGGEGMVDAGEEGGFFGKGSAIADDSEGVHLKAVVVMEAKGLMLDDTRVELEA